MKTTIFPGIALPPCSSVLAVFIFSLEFFGRLSLPVNHFSFTSALASRGQGCPRHGFLGCHDHHCLLHMRLWASTWAPGPVEKVDVDHWAL